jgi:hypothetical protein
MQTPNQKNTKFKSPFVCDSSKIKLSLDTPKKLTVEEKIQSLESELAELNKQINDLNSKNLDLKELDIIIDKFHKYNEIKDLGLTLIERLAIYKELTIKEFFKIYEIDLEKD